MDLTLGRRTILVGAGIIGATALAPSCWRHAQAVAAAERPELPPLDELPLDRSEPGVARGRLVAAPLVSPIVGNLLCYSGRYPGPLIRLKENERLQLSFENRTGEPSNLHYHGLAVEPGGTGDNPWVSVPDGERFIYAFDVPSGNAGLHWYHPHLHGRLGTSGFAQMRGLVGPILVEGAEPDPLPEADDRIVILHDMAIEAGLVQRPKLNEWAVGQEGRQLFVNGVRYPKITVHKPWLRLRLVNASNARYWRFIPSDAAPLFAVARDGGLLAAAHETQDILLPPGARMEVMIPVGGRMPFDLLYSPYDRVGSVHTAEFPAIHVRPEAVTAEIPPLPARLADWPPFETTKAARRRDIPVALLTICGRYFDDTRTDFRVETGSTEIWTLRNVDLMDHPIHLHTWRFEVLSLNGSPAPYRARLDTHNLRPGDVLEVGIRFERFRGRSLLHCHIVEHADKGMMALIEAV